MAPLLEMRGIRKSFLGVEVLHGVDLDCDAGEIHAVVGENGAGKSTLMKVLAGVHGPDAGEVLIDGRPVSFSHPVQAQAAGVAIIFQEFNLLPDRTVAENVFVNREPTRRGFVDIKAMERRTEELLEEVGEVSFGPRTLVRQLSTAQQQVVEIVKALSLDARLLVLDEPTAALAEHEVDVLFALLRRLRERGLGMLYISHRLREIFSICDRITVLKDGEHVATLATAEVDTGKLISLMVGRELDGYFPPRGTAEEVGDVRLKATDVTTRVLEGISLEVRAGEIVGLAGLQGSGRTELARALFGADPMQSGTVEVDGKRVGRTPRGGINAGMGFITEDRKLEGLALAQPIRDNTLLALRALGGKQRRRLPNTVSVQDLARSVELRARSLEQEARFLSGGNQQKVVLAKWLAVQPGVLIFDEPTRGVDVGAKAGIHDLMRGLARDGVAILMISSEMPELIGLADRILVMRSGQLAGELPAGAAETEIMRLAAAEPVEAA
ncbi:MAG TPA: sugar ABC transporter ATP-binding protein [Solirubrobacteraceae bacterium]|nr:sugar ABC transporter ATP-binding protein [Solirubrobacteraceae bacterium]